MTMTAGEDEMKRAVAMARAIIVAMQESGLGWQDLLPALLELAAMVARPVGLSREFFLREAAAAYDPANDDEPRRAS